MERTNELLRRAMKNKDNPKIASKNVMLKKTQSDLKTTRNVVYTKRIEQKLNSKFDSLIREKSSSKALDTERHFESATKCPKLKIDVDMTDVVETFAKTSFQPKNIENFNFTSLKTAKNSIEGSNVNSPFVPPAQIARKDMHTAIQNYTGSFSMSRRQNSQAQLQREKLGYVLLDTLKDNNCDSKLLKNFEFCQENIKHKIKTILLSHQVKLFDSNRRFKISSPKDLDLLKASIEQKYDRESIKNDSKLYSEYISNK